ncbi:Hypothetical predicted protein [Podarcis lilfordi]|uniref:Uncharacterized protein n=1 Tax=Podarcis lilfordi TaxID=74358 RepID=A0AA35JWM5_9SAUR|nr:Hypothetical predicted protein [Podarcis lilfordi]
MALALSNLRWVVQRSPRPGEEPERGFRCNTSGRAIWSKMLAHQLAYQLQLSMTGSPGLLLMRHLHSQLTLSLPQYKPPQVSRRHCWPFI